MSENKNFWLNDISILYKNNAYLDFYPTFAMNRIEQLNALSRFCIYVLIISILMKKSVWFSLIGLSIICIVYYLLKYQNIDILKNESNDMNKNIKTLQEFELYKATTSRKPTEDNPFMNNNLNDAQTFNPPEPCNIDDKDIKDEIKNKFNANLFRDVSDVFEAENSQRQFHTVVNMDTPDQPAFAKWLYGKEGTCKTDPTKCLKYEDVRFQRNNF